MQSAKQEGIKNYFLSLWYERQDLTPISQAIREHTNYKTNGLFLII